MSKKKYRTRSEFISVRFLIKMHRIVSEPMNFFLLFFWKIKKKKLLNCYTFIKITLIMKIIQINNSLKINYSLLKH